MVCREARRRYGIAGEVCGHGGTRRDRAQAEEAGIRKAKPWNQFCAAAVAETIRFRRNPPMGRRFFRWFMPGLHLRGSGIV
jgi:hypothetical protein